MSLIEQEAPSTGPEPSFATLVEQFQIFADRGDHEAMMDCAARAVQTWPGARRAWYLLSIGLLVVGNQTAARLAMLKAVRVGYEPQAPWLFETFMLYLEASGEDMPRLAEILKPCPIFGRMKKQLDPVIASTIDQLIQGHVARFESGAFERPRLIPKKLDNGPARPLKILMLHTEFVNLKGVLDGNLRNDIADVLEYSANAQGFDVYRSQATDLLICSPSITGTQVSNALALLDQEMERFKPDILLVDSNFVGQANSLQPVHLAVYRARGVKVAGVMGDLYDTRPNLLDHWGPGCDVMIYFNSCTSHAGATMYRDKAMYWPGLPFEESLFQPLAPADRSIDLCIIGSLNRGREYYARIMEGSGFPGLYLIHDRTAEKALPISEYRAHLCRSRMVFNNGTISANQRILTGRVFEAIYAGALLLEESGNDIDQLYVPWVHYLPFANVHQLTALAQYIQAREDVRQAMAGRALAWTKAHFAPADFWQHMRARLAL